MTEELSNNVGDINTERNKLISAVVVQGMSVEDAMKQYESNVGDKVKEVIDSLNATIKK